MEKVAHAVAAGDSRRDSGADRGLEAVVALKLAVIGTFHGRHSATLPLLRRVLVESTRRPDEFWILCEDDEDGNVAAKALVDLIASEPDANWDGIGIIGCPTPRQHGSYAVIPYSNKINFALDRTDADVICYLDNGSMPHPEKYRWFAWSLASNPDWGAVYVTQHRTGFRDETHVADKIIENGHGQINYTQFAHRRTADRWTLDLKWANPDLADAMFLADLSKSLGPLYPVGGPEPLDEHRMDSEKAAGL